MNRRTFLKSSFSAAAATHLPLAALAPIAAAQAPAAPGDRILVADWEFYRGPLDPRFQVWHSEELVTWEHVTLPHCVNHYDACDPDVPAYRGQSWYRTRLPIQNPYPNGRTLLHIEAASQSAEVWAGNTKLAAHTGGYDEWMVDLTSAAQHLVQAEPLQLAILCDNGRDIDRMPSDLSDFTLYGGLYRPVHLVYVPAVSLEAVHTRVAFEPGGPATITVSARLYNPEQTQGPADITIEILDPDGNPVHRATLSRPLWTGETNLTETSLSASHLWSPSKPNLYRCKVTFTCSGQTSSTTHRFGIRHTRFETHGPFFLNGERLLLHGTQRHEDHADYAAAMPADLIREELTLMREMGANMVRLAHYQQRSLVLDLCDELGIFVWEEVPWCRSGVVSEKFQQLGKTLLAAMIDQHSNHASVLIWGLGNEDDWPTEPNGADHQAIRAYMTELRDLAHQLDPTRLTGYRRCDFARDIPDVYSPSIWAGWYSGVYTDYAAALEKARDQVPHMMHVEWGADSHAGRYAEDADPSLARVKSSTDTAERGFDYKMTGGAARVSRDGTWSETYACDLFDWYLKTIEATPWLTGALQWVFKDFTTPLRVDNPVPRINQKGLLTRSMTPKEGYFVFQSYWSPKPMLRIFGHNWPVRWGAKGQQRLVRVYSNCQQVELFLNGASVGTRHRDPEDFPCAGLRWHLAFRTGTNDLRAVGKAADGKQITDNLQFIYESRPWSAPASLRLTELRRSGSIVTAQAELLDASGVRCLDARNVVRFSFAGEGRMIDNQGTPDGSRVVQLYNGRAELSVELVSAGTLAVACQGIAPAFLSLDRRAS